MYLYCSFDAILRLSYLSSTDLPTISQPLTTRTYLVQNNSYPYRLQSTKLLGIQFFTILKFKIITEHFNKMADHWSEWISYYVYSCLFLRRIWLWYKQRNSFTREIFKTNLKMCVCVYKLYLLLFSIVTYQSIPVFRISDSWAWRWMYHNTNTATCTDCFLLLTLRLLLAPVSVEARLHFHSHRTNTGTG